MLWCLLIFGICGHFAFFKAFVGLCHFFGQTLCKTYIGSKRFSDLENFLEICEVTLWLSSFWSKPHWDSGIKRKEVWFCHTPNIMCGTIYSHVFLHRLGNLKRNSLKVFLINWRVIPYLKMIFIPINEGFHIIPVQGMKKWNWQVHCRFKHGTAHWATLWITWYIEKP